MVMNSNGLVATAFALTAVLSAGVGCAETQNEQQDLGSQLDLGERDQFVPPDGQLPPDTTCGYFSTQAKQVPAAMMIVLDRSSSMTTNGKWAAAQQAIVQAIDKSPFDNMRLGLLVYPSYPLSSPPCLWIVPQVSCGVSALPQVPLADSGSEKATGASGPRKAIYQWLASNGPDGTATDASPGYAALKAGIDAVQGNAVAGRRLVLLITDGGFSCTSVSNPTRPGYSDGLCPDWEHPASVIKLLADAHAHQTKPVDTFIIGVPGSDSAGQQQGPYATAPYHMRLALSAYAHAGSPNTVPPTCDFTFAQTAKDPKVPCHFDMTQGNFDAAALATIIGDIRGAALGCVYELPEVDDKNQVIDKGKVNVRVTVDGGPTIQMPRRKDASDSCEQTPCWDYDKDGNVELLGKACKDVKAAFDAKVELIVGCSTVIK
jgi:hypothetical protein